jgi:MoxR-like ATPase
VIGTPGGVRAIRRAHVLQCAVPVSNSGRPDTSGWQTVWKAPGATRRAGCPSGGITVTQRVDLGRTDGPAVAAADPADGLVQGAPVDLATVQQVGGQIAAAISQVVLGKPEVIRLAIIAVLAEGHLLIEDVPGTGKTVLAKSLARTVDSTVSRVQFTPDLMPSDVTGVSIYDRQSAQFEFRPGPIFANIVVADEINRASPKTQSALLECMEERQVTVDGTSYRLARPFLVLATQNPVEMEGTYPLPEAQRDRFLARLSIGYPDHTAEIAMLADRDRIDPLDQLRAVTDAAVVSKLIDAVNTVHLAPPLRQYVVEIVGATRTVPEVRLGASPRAVLHLARAAKAAAALDGRPFVVPDDVQRLAVPVLAHRLLLTVEAHAAHRSAEEVVMTLLNRIRVPRSG